MWGNCHASSMSIASSIESNAALLSYSWKLWLLYCVTGGYFAEHFTQQLTYTREYFGANDSLIASDGRARHCLTERRAG